MNVAQEGDRVKLGYTGKLENGKVFETSQVGGPAQFTVGSGEVFPALERAIVGMSVGETKTITVPQEQAFGQKKEELIVNVPRTSFIDATPEIGSKHRLRMSDGKIMETVVLRVDEEKVALDANHPLAGNALTFDIQLLEII
jgi:peptidylprolyl isomerase